MMDSYGDDTVCTELELKIIEQIQYYFGDVNLTSDKFLKQEMMKDDGWILIETLLTFNRMKALTLKPEIVANAMKKSNAGIVEISDDRKKLRRNSKKPLPEITDEYKKLINERSVHVKGFPLKVTFDQLKEFCKKFGTVESIKMRNDLKTKTFKGCIFVVFANKEDAQKMIDSNKLKYEDHSLRRENMVKYYEKKNKFYEQKKNKRESKESKHNDWADVEMDSDVRVKKEKKGLSPSVVKQKMDDDEMDSSEVNDNEII